MLVFVLVFELCCVVSVVVGEFCSCRCLCRFFVVRVVGVCVVFWFNSGCL